MNGVRKVSSHQTSSPQTYFLSKKKKKKKKSGLFFNLNDCFNTDPCRNNLAEFKFYDRYGDEQMDR